MFIPAKTNEPQRQIATFNQAKSLFEQLKQNFSNVDTLSMGMTADMQTAIHAGSTMIRVGTGLFGQRIPPQKNNT